MSYHHILVSFSDEPKKLRCVLSDLPKQDVQKRFATPYSKGKDILCGNEIIHVAKISTVQIIRTDRDIETELSDIQEKSFKEIEEFNRNTESVALISIGRGHDKEDIVEAGVDVTSDFIAGAAGYASTNKLVRLLHNPWVVRVGGGLILAAILAWWKLG